MARRSTIPAHWHAHRWNLGWLRRTLGDIVYLIEPTADGALLHRLNGQGQRVDAQGRRTKAGEACASVAEAAGRAEGEMR